MCLSDECADTYSDTSETGRRRMSLSGSISRSSVKLLLLCSGGRVCTSKNSELCFTANAHTFTLTHRLGFKEKYHGLAYKSLQIDAKATATSNNNYSTVQKY